jgi:hypothetical protein
MEWQLSGKFEQCELVLGELEQRELVFSKLEQCELEQRELVGRLLGQITLVTTKSGASGLLP